MTQLVKYEAMRQAIIEAHSVDELVEIRNRAEAFRVYAKQSKLGKQDVNRVTEIKLRAERRAGELLIEMKTAQGKRNDKLSATVAESSELREALDHLSANGTSERTAYYWQDIAALPEDSFEQAITEGGTGESELTTTKVLKAAKKHKRQKKAEKMAESPLPTAKYRIWYADPPWKYNDSGDHTVDKDWGKAEKHYPTMSIDELCRMGRKIKESSEDDSVLFLWVTSPLLKDCFQVIDAWGFEYKTSFVWDKVKPGLGYYNSVRHELLLVCTRGSCTPDASTRFDSVVSIERSAKHSEKPEEFRRIIDSLYTYGKRIELFARTKSEGWDAWGNEC